MDKLNNYFSKKKLARAIELPFSDIEDMLDKYIYFKGLIQKDGCFLYVDDYFILEQTEMNIPDFTVEEYESGYAYMEPDMAAYEVVIAVKGAEFSKNSELIGNSYKLKKPKEVDEIFYSYQQLCDLSKNIGIPQPKSKEELLKKEFVYDVNILNLKSNFTLKEASQIAGNVYGCQIEETLYLEMLSDCIKGTNIDGFKLHTVELWCFYHSYEEDNYSKPYDNGTYLKQRALLDYNLTIISKLEFIRWCNYEGIDTGLTYVPKDFDESIEALKEENIKLKQEILRPAPQLALPLKAKNDKEIEQLKKQLKVLNEQLDSQTYPPELQIAIDAYETLVRNNTAKPLNKNIKLWLSEQSIVREIGHVDLGTNSKGLSEKVKEVIAKIIKS
ncbi:hypothetical protein [Shewanella sp. OMA3-2]|uniref:hypothetical protein n=1 Tax=Shewanella sp. OMA3-2 TaxID=2908650 RepID=UPI001F2C656E|nr:hypothetical protein [Shewanella sp. OMA3-2]UJF21499.1 hypothetical protein L0B17_15695 [Shewanella sp. OMA3-2]